ncbi:MAG: sulfur oxidation c-type cytochrome SoxA [Sulfurimonadaceae bacterium]|jgi:sulfur-oxidizing protein SoxA|nr:sulfur oxidation c-type cytochrome SoxA [Sulfurimonadaceae bacterium]
MRLSTKTAIIIALFSSLSFASEQFSMSDADRAMYEEMLEDNPAAIMIDNGNSLLDEYCGGEDGVAKFLGLKTEKLPEYIAGFPRYIKSIDRVVGIDQMLQALMHKNGHKPFTLKSSDMFDMSSYVKSLANGVAVNIDVSANKHMKEAYALGKEVFDTKRGGRGLSCLSCHNKDVIGGILRTQPLPDFGVNNTGGTWPAYRMTKSELTTLQKRFQGCMNNALLAVIPLGSKEMNALEVYITEKSKGQEIAIPGLKR